jgi:hypothetical protein
MMDARPLAAIGKRLAVELEKRCIAISLGERSVKDGKSIRK